MRGRKQKEAPAKRKTHSLELKLQVLQQLKAGAAVSDVCRAFGLAVTTVALWRRAYAQGGYEGLVPKKPGAARAADPGSDPRPGAGIAAEKSQPGERKPGDREVA